MVSLRMSFDNISKRSRFLSSRDINLNEIQAIKKKLSKFNFQLIINCAAFNNVDLAELEKKITISMLLLLVK